jgi:serine/threonine protein kinase
MTEVRNIGGFELLEKIGQGGMGAVFRARQINMDRIVAVKLLPRKFAQQKQFIERFVREARASARLNHPNIVNGIDVGQEDGLYYFAMEYVKGVTLKDIINKQGRLSEEETIKYTRPIAHALAHAHQNGILHRDIKPDNVLVDETGTPKLCDLGLARIDEDSEEDKGLTSEGHAVGTPHYISPEQARGERNLDAKADLYSLGASMYHMLCGTPMFNGTTAVSIMSRHISEYAPHPHDIGVKLSKGMIAVLSKLVVKERGDRYSSGQKLVEDLDRLSRGEAPLHADLPASRTPFKTLLSVSKGSVGRTAPVTRSAGGKSAPLGNLSSTVIDRPRVRSTSSRGTQAGLFLTGMGLVAVVGAAAFYAMNRSDPQAAIKQPKAPQHEPDQKHSEEKPTPPLNKVTAVPDSQPTKTAPQQLTGPENRTSDASSGNQGSPSVVPPVPPDESVAVKVEPNTTSVAVAEPIKTPPTEAPKVVPQEVSNVPTVPVAPAIAPPAESAPAAVSVTDLMTSAVTMGKDTRFADAAKLFSEARSKGGFSEADALFIATRAEAYATLAGLKITML